MEPLQEAGDPETRQDEPLTQWLPSPRHQKAEGRWMIANHLRPVGGAWHVVAVPQPHEIDTVYYHLFYKRRVGYERIHDLDSWQITCERG